MVFSRRGEEGANFPATPLLQVQFYQNLITYVVLLAVCIVVGKGLLNFIFRKHHQAKKMSNKAVIDLSIKIFQLTSIKHKKR